MIRDGKWETDAGNISNYDMFDRFVYKNGSVESFLYEDNKYFIIAAKGIGKTLLLSYKRYLLEQKYRDKGVLFIPSDHHHYIDVVESIQFVLSTELIKQLEDWQYCKKLWELVIKITILSYLDFYNVDEFVNSSPRLSKHRSTLYLLLKSVHSVDYVLNELIRMGETALTSFVYDVSNEISNLFRKIQQSIIMFFDRLDNALETAHDSIWNSLQSGLLAGAWEVIRSNSHVKIYLSIRQEAYAKHNSNNKNALSGSVVQIEYTRKELRNLLNHLVYFYENKGSLESFLGFDTFPNTIIFDEEPVYNFMYRYSIGRPRDFVQFCDMLSRSKNGIDDDNEKRMALKDKIRYTSSNVIISSLFSELRMLLHSLKTEEVFDSFLMNLTVNVLTYSDLQNICSQFNGDGCDHKCENCPNGHHPFCDLYNMGLLGTVEQDHGRYIQHFKTPYEDMTAGLRMDSKYFLIHPALREYINNLHSKTKVGMSYNLYYGILVGENLPWKDEYDKLYLLNKMIGEVKNTVYHDFFIKTLKKYIKSKRFRFPQREYEAIIAPQMTFYHQKMIDSIVSFFKTRTLEKPIISAFISYTSVDEVHQKRVEGFVNMLRKFGINANMDLSLKEEYPDIDEMMDVGLGMDKVIIVLSEEYKRRADEKEGGVWKEFRRIAPDMDMHPKKYIFVSFEKITTPIKEKISPSRIGNKWIVDLEADKNKNYSELMAFIRGEKEYPFLPPSKDLHEVEHVQIPSFD